MKISNWNDIAESNQKIWQAKIFSGSEAVLPPKKKSLWRRAGQKKKKSRAIKFWPRWEFIIQSIRAPPKHYDYDEHSMMTVPLSILLAISDAIMNIGVILISGAIGRGRQFCSLSRPLTRKREATLLGTEKRKSLWWPWVLGRWCSNASGDCNIDFYHEIGQQDFIVDVLGIEESQVFLNTNSNVPWD